MDHITSEVVNLFPLCDSIAEGTLEVGSRNYYVLINQDDMKRMGIRVRVIEGLNSKKTRHEVFYRIASKGLLDPSWRPLAVDPRDGEILYSTVLTCDISSAALDRFLREAVSFLQEHGDELHAILDDCTSTQNADIGTNGNVDSLGFFDLDQIL